MLRTRIQFFPCAHCSVVFVDCDARRSHYRQRHPKKVLPKDFIDFQPSIEVNPKAESRIADLEDEDEYLFEKHFSISSPSTQPKPNIFARKTPRKSPKKSPAAASLATKSSPGSSKSPQTPANTTESAQSSPKKARKGKEPKPKKAQQVSNASKSTNSLSPRSSKHQQATPEMNGSMSNLISIQNVQFVANPNQPGTGLVHQAGGDANSTMGAMNQQKVAFMPISDGSNIVQIPMTGLMNATPLYANIAHHPGHAQQQQFQLVQVCPQPVQLMDGQVHAQEQAQQIVSPPQQQIALNAVNGKKGRKKKGAAAQATENRAQVPPAPPAKERKMKANGKRYNCSQCPKFFSTIYNRRRHEEMFHIQAQASNSQQFRCETCDKAFPNLFNLTRHENIHKPITERLRYKCEMVNCKRRFTTLFILKTHLRKVHNMEPNF